MSLGIINKSMGGIKTHWLRVHDCAGKFSRIMTLEITAYYKGVG
jgi:hypothetical protein